MKTNSFVCNFLREYESTNGFLFFCKNCLSGKNQVVELWPENIQTNQNVEFFKL